MNSGNSPSIKMSSMQWRIVLLCVWLNVIDGIDVMVAAFTANAIASEWVLSCTALGWVLSIVFLGMAVGSICLASFGDRLGRHPILLLCLLVCGTTHDNCPVMFHTMATCRRAQLKMGILPDNAGS